MTCPKCRNEGRGRFCNKCGVALVAAAAATSGGATPQTIASAEPTINFPQLGYCDCGTNLLKLSGACQKCGKQRVPVCSICEKALAEVDGDKVTAIVSENGVCSCGMQRLPKLIDHCESRIDARAGGACDRGVKHDYNMDRMAARMVAVIGEGQLHPSSLRRCLWLQQRGGGCCRGVEARRSMRRRISSLSEARRDACISAVGRSKCSHEAHFCLMATEATISTSLASDDYPGGNRHRSKGDLRLAR